MRTFVQLLISTTIFTSVSASAKLSDSEVTRIERRLEQIKKEIALDLGKDAKALRAEQQALESRLELRRAEERFNSARRQAPLEEGGFEPETSLSRARASSSRFRGMGVLGAVGPVLDLGLQGVEAVSGKLDESIEASLRKGECPSWLARDTKKLATALTTFSLADRDRVINACSAAGTPLAYESTITGSKKDQSVGWSQIRCQNNGRIVLIHQNGTRSTIDFAAHDRLAEISTRSSSAPEGSLAAVKIVKDADGDRFVVNDKKGETLYNYPWTKGIAALTCAKEDSGMCTAPKDMDSFHRAVVPALDLNKATKNNFDGNVGQVGHTMYQLRGLVGLMPQAPTTFEGTCAALGGQLPKTEVQYAPKAPTYTNRDDSPITYEGARSAT